MSLSKYETYACVRCAVQVPWYDKGDPAWRDWEYEKKLCSTCRDKASPEERFGKLPAPTVPCACGSVEFLRAPLREHVGERCDLRAVHLSVGPKATRGQLFVLACRGCGRAELRVAGIDRVQADPALETEVVRIDSAGPYR